MQLDYMNAVLFILIYCCHRPAILLCVILNVNFVGDLKKTTMSNVAVYIFILYILYVCCLS